MLSIWLSLVVAVAAVDILLPILVLVAVVAQEAIAHLLGHLVAAHQLNQR
jgi:hypothetical protein